jgi:hypothetical protein
MVLAVGLLVGWLVPAAAAAAGRATPLTTSWGVTSFRGTHTTVDVPLAPGAVCTPSAQPLPTGLASGHHAATVRIAACAAPSGSRPGTARLQVQGLSAIGKYTGTINLLPDSPPAGALALTIQRTDLVVFPILALLIGIGLAIAAGRLTGRSNPISTADQQTWQLDARLPRVAMDFAQATVGLPWADLSFEPSAKQLLNSAREELNTLRRGFTAIDKADPTLRSVTADLTVVSTALAIWPQLPAQLVELAQATDDVRSLAPAFHPPGATPLPTLVSVASGLLVGETVEVRTVARYGTDVQTSTTALRAMARDARTLIGLRTRADAILVAIGNDPAQNDRRNYAMWALRGIETALRAMWTATNAAAYLALPLPSDLNTIAGTLDALDPSPQPAFAPDFRPPPAPAPPSPPPPPTAATATSRAALIGRIRLVDNTLLVVLLAGVTLWSGLVALYFGRPWGTVIDYGTALVWGFGAQAALQSLATGLDVLVRRVQPPAATREPTP